MNIEEKYSEYIERAKTDLTKHMDDVITNIHCDLLPHVESDTISNVQTQAQAVVNNMLAGRFEVDGPFSVKVADNNGMTVTVSIGDHEHDMIRRALVEAMPGCPKDLEIVSLKDQIRNMQNRGIY